MKSFGALLVLGAAAAVAVLAPSRLVGSSSAANQASSPGGGGKNVLMAAGARDENDMFGSGSQDASPPTVSPTPSSFPLRGDGAPRASSEQGEGGDAARLEARSSPDAFASGTMKDDPLDIGGTLYQQFNSTFQRNLTEGEQPLAIPLQFDAYLDSRPNDRVRGYIGARLLYDSSKDVYGKATAGGATTLTNFSAATFTAAPLPNNPQVVLDQAWLKFDIQRTAFLSLGKQHVKWGTGRIWNPSDALSPQRRDPLQPYDLRLGSNMATVQLPWEAKQANLYAIALLDNPQPASTLQQVGGAVRIEGLLGPMEIGLDAVGHAKQNPRFGADLSTPLGPFDFYAEAALLTGNSYVNYQYKGLPRDTTYTVTLSDIYAVNKLPGSVIQAVGGLDYTWSWRDSRSATVGVEYMYNELGIDDGGMIPVLVYLGQYQPFYVAKHYAALYISAEGPDAGKKTSYNLSTISNLVDWSAVTRLDFRWLLLDYLTFGAYGSVNYGGRGGEFNFSLNTPKLMYGTTVIPAIDIPGSSGEVGGSLRVSF